MPLVFPSIELLGYIGILLDDDKKKPPPLNQAYHISFDVGTKERHRSPVFTQATMSSDQV